jgi:hypothetical protein
MEECRPSARERVGRTGKVRVSDGHLQEEARVEECLEDRPRVVVPVGVHIRREPLASALGDDLKKPGVQGMTRKKLTQRRDDLFDLTLQREHLEAVMIEAINRILVAPVAA